MKTRFRLTILFVLVLQSVLISGCEHHEEAVHHIGLQASEGECGDLQTSDLNLSDGFRGTSHKNPSTADSDFTIRGHDAIYPFSEEVDPGNCKGICAFRITFESSDPENPVEAANVQVSNVGLSYSDGNSIVSSSNVAYDWAYPHLEIYDVVANGVVDYDVSFLNNVGPSLSVADVEVLGGLCVIENVDLIDPVIFKVPVGTTLR